MSVFHIISLFGGLALFLYGMRMMGDGLKKGSSTALKKAMEKVTNNPFMGFLMGLAVTAVIQSSTATIVLTSGLVGAGIITLHQSLGIILGANVGTTVTGQIIRLLDVSAGETSWLNVFKPSTLAPLACILGVLIIMTVKNSKTGVMGSIAMGFGILFTGLLNMTAAVAPLSESPTFAKLFIDLADKPLLGFLAGAAAAFAIQSSSATVGILQALSMAGRLTGGSIYSVISGIYMGDCITTAIVCSIGAKADARRTGVVHILFNLGQVLLVTLGVNILHSLGVLNGLWAEPMTSGGIANTHTLFKLSCALLLLPVCGLFEKLSYLIVKDDKQVGVNVSRELEMLNEKLYASPSLAFASVQTAISTMAKLASDGVCSALGTFYNFDQKVIDVVNENEEQLDHLTDVVDRYLIAFSPYLNNSADNDRLNYYIQCFPEFERIGDLAVNLTEDAAELHDSKRVFSATAQHELKVIESAIREILEYAIWSFTEMDPATARKIEPVEEVIDDMVATLRANHILRLREGSCETYAGLTFLDMLVNLERIADQCSNVGIYVISQQPEHRGMNHHDYTKSLHHGDDAFFNEMYQQRHNYYYDLLNQEEAADQISGQMTMEEN
ncbi:MAG: Na/Pi cotransporter family protein [Clostridia bacterium]|nr:Na/Pi cotransporter family protein [Clostridia bacterium]